MPLSAVDELLYQYNAWWESRPDLIGIRPRANLVERIRALLSAKRILHLTGLRRVGKTTLMRLLADRLIGEGALPQSILCVSMDDYLLRKQSITDTVGAFRTIHKISVDRPVVLLFDEITYEADYQQQLKYLVDRENVTILATSSSSSLVRDQKAFLTGRSTTLEVQPLSFPEYLEFKRIRVARPDQHLLDAYFRDYIREGGLPEHVLEPSRDYLMDLVDDIIQKDILAFRGLKDHHVPRDYFTLLMEQRGKQASINKISNILKISPDTSRRYLGYFEDAYLVHLPSRWGKTTERILSPKKVYACGLGIKYLFVGDRDLGSYFENCVYLLLRPRQTAYYLYEDGIELDFLTEDRTLLECTYNVQMQGKQLQAFSNYPAKRRHTIDSVKALSVIEDLWEPGIATKLSQSRGR